MKLYFTRKSRNILPRNFLYKFINFYSNLVIFILFKHKIDYKINEKELNFMKDYTVLGIDVGNSTCESNTGVIFDSKITDVEPLSKVDTLLIDKKTYWLSEGNYDTTYRKADKENYINFLFGVLALSTDTVNNYIVLGFH